MKRINWVGKAAVYFTIVAVSGLAASVYWGTSTTSAASNKVGEAGFDPNAGSIWARDNLVAWEVTPFDNARRNSEERARMLKRVGFNHFAYLPSRLDDIKKEMAEYERDVDLEIEALQRNGVNVHSWFFWIDSTDPTDDPKVRATLESFKRHGICPQLWIAQSHSYIPRDPEQWARYFPGRIARLISYAEYSKLTETEKHADRMALLIALARLHSEDYPRTADEQIRRIQNEADRINAFVKMASPYGCKVHIYNHAGWFGLIENQLAILERLKELGTSNVGMVYNFSHARDVLHDDSREFEEVWRKIKPHVVAVNITAMKMDTGEVWYPSQGDGEVGMMRIIQDSGWRGPVGLIVQRREDAEMVLRNDLRGLDWIAAELRKAGSGGERPFPLMPTGVL